MISQPLGYKIVANPRYTAKAKRKNSLYYFLHRVTNWFATPWHNLIVGLYTSPTLMVECNREEATHETVLITGVTDVQYVEDSESK